MGENVDVVAWDKDGMPHAIEIIYEEYFRIGILWHLERSYARSKILEQKKNAKDNQKIFDAWVQKVIERKL